MNAFTQFTPSNINCGYEDLHCFSYLNKVENIEIDGDQVFFTLTNESRSFIDVRITAKETTINITVHGDAPWDDQDYDVPSLCVDVKAIGMIVEVDDVYAVFGWPVRLTTDQQNDLNLYLTEHFTELAEAA